MSGIDSTVLWVLGMTGQKVGVPKVVWKRGCGSPLHQISVVADVHESTPFSSTTTDQTVPEY